MGECYQLKPSQARAFQVNTSSKVGQPLGSRNQHLAVGSLGWVTAQTIEKPLHVSHLAYRNPLHPRFLILEAHRRHPVPLAWCKKPPTTSGTTTPFTPLLESQPIFTSLSKVSPLTELLPLPLSKLPYKICPLPLLARGPKFFSPLARLHPVCSKVIAVCFNLTCLSSLGCALV